MARQKALAYQLAQAQAEMTAWERSQARNGAIIAVFGLLVLVLAAVSVFVGEAERLCRLLQ